MAHWHRWHHHVYLSTIALLIVALGAGFAGGFATHDTVVRLAAGGLLRPREHVRPHAPVLGAGLVHVDLSADLGDVKEQGASNSCVVQSEVGSLEWDWHHAGSPRTFSAWAVYKQVQGDLNRGTTFDEVASTLITQGAPRTVYYTYGEYGPWPSADALADALYHRDLRLDYVFSGSYGAADVDAMRATLARTQHPLVVAFHVYGSWLQATGQETLPATSGPFEFDHAVLIYGAQDDPAWAGGGYFLLQNSWGAGWGQGGRIKVSYQTATQTAFAAVLLTPRGLPIAAPSTATPRPPATATPHPRPTPTTRPHATSSPRPVPTPTAAPHAYSGVYVLTHSTNLRAAARRTARIVRGLAKGQRLRSLGAGSAHWVQVHVRHTTGWVWRAFVRREQQTSKKVH